MSIVQLSSSFVLTFLLFFNSACHRAIDFGDKGPIRDAQALLQLIDLSDSGLQRIQGEAKMRIEGPSGKGVVTLFVGVSAPNAMHLESLNFFGKPSAILVSDGTAFRLYDSEEGKFFQGPATAQTLARLLPLSLKPEQWVALFLGRAPRHGHVPATLRVDEAQRAYQLTWGQGDAIQHLWVDLKGFHVLKSEVSGANAYTVEFQDWTSRDGVRYPGKIQVRVPGASLMAELRFHDVELNPTMDASLFELAPPVNVPVVYLDGQGQVLEAPR